MGRHRFGLTMRDTVLDTDLARTVALSHELVAAVEQGNVAAVANLDAERLRLLHSMRAKFTNMDAGERLMLRQVTELNDQAIGMIEHLRRRTERDMDLA